MFRSVISPTLQDVMTPDTVLAMYAPIRHGSVVLCICLLNSFVLTLQDAMTPDTVLVTIMHSNNEVGSIQAIPEITTAVRAANQQGKGKAVRLATDRTHCHSHVCERCLAHARVHARACVQMTLHTRAQLPMSYNVPSIAALSARSARGSAHACA